MKVIEFILTHPLGALYLITGLYLTLLFLEFTARALNWFIKKFGHYL